MFVVLRVISKFIKYLLLNITDVINWLDLKHKHVHSFSIFTLLKAYSYYGMRNWFGPHGGGTIG